jgi:hypothetical protein
MAYVLDGKIIGETWIEARGSASALPMVILLAERLSRTSAPAKAGLHWLASNSDDQGLWDSS